MNKLYLLSIALFSFLCTKVVAQTPSITGTVTRSNDLPNQFADYTFTYTTPVAIGTGTATNNIFLLENYLTTPAAPSFVAYSSSQLFANGNITLKINGQSIPLDDTRVGIFSTWGGGIQISTYNPFTGIAVSPGIVVPANSVIEVVVKNIITNPSSASTYYAFSWRTADNQGISTNVYVGTSTTLSVSTFQSIDAKIYPNPSNGIFNISISDNANLEVYDIVGKKIKNQKVNSGDSSLDLSNYNAGIYLLKVTNEQNQTKTMKLVKQ